MHIDIARRLIMTIQVAVLQYRCCSRPRTLWHGTQYNYHNSQRSRMRVRAETGKKHQDMQRAIIKSFFSYARCKQRTEEAIGPLINDNGETVEDPMEQANILNDFFSSVFMVEDKSSLRTRGHACIDIQSI